MHRGRGIKGGVYLYLHCFPLYGVVTVVAIVRTDKDGVTEEVVLNRHEVAETRRDHLEREKTLLVCTSAISQNTGS